MNGSCSVTLYVAPECFRLSMKKVLNISQALGVCLFPPPFFFSAWIYFFSYRHKAKGLCVVVDGAVDLIIVIKVTSDVVEGIIFPIYF